MLNKFFSKFADGDIKPSSKPDRDGRIHYQFQCGLKACQSELTIEQDEKLTELILKVEISELNKMTIEDIVNALVKAKLITSFLSIILEGLSAQRDEYSVSFSEDTDPGLGKITNSELDTIAKDFFTLNPKVIEWLKTFGDVLTSGLMTQNTSDTEQTEKQSQKDSPKPAEKT